MQYKLLALFHLVLVAKFTCDDDFCSSSWSSQKRWWWKGICSFCSFSRLRCSNIERERRENFKKVISGLLEQSSGSPCRCGCEKRSWCLENIWICLWRSTLTMNNIDILRWFLCKTANSRKATTNVQSELFYVFPEFFPRCRRSFAFGKEWVRGNMLNV